ncbi:hypothetical protein Dimus_035825 [Dionaea muscipula]
MENHRGQGLDQPNEEKIKKLNEKGRLCYLCIRGARSPRGRALRIRPGGGARRTRLGEEEDDQLGTRHLSYSEMITLSDKLDSPEMSSLDGGYLDQDEDGVGRRRESLSDAVGSVRKVEELSTMVARSGRRRRRRGCLVAVVKGERRP